MKKFTAFAAFSGFLTALAGSAWADQPKPWEIWHQAPASDIMDRIEWFDAYTLWFIIPITVLVMFLLLFVMLRFNRRANPVASKTSHNSVVEVIWTIVPIIILVFIAFPSFNLLQRQLAPEEEPQMTVKATGYQWYWGYEYQDNSDISFDSIILQEDERAEAGKTDKAIYPRLLAVNNELVVPVNTMVRVLVAGADVIHSFAVPSFGIKIDAVPGRINETWFKAEREGIYYGQCSELCGRDHAFMPIAVRVVSMDQYNAWKAKAADDLEGANKMLMAEIARERAIRVAGN
ncbi:MAG: cytochrome c oxidase subunit II [Salaquimonas sp.]|nr:cytochrome c oxidase subunit II [Salaquimonas sp.]